MNIWRAFIPEGPVSFNGCGILAHNTRRNVYTGSYALNETTNNNNPVTNGSSN